MGPDFRWVTWQNAKSGGIKVMVLESFVPTPVQPKGWVLLQELAHNPAVSHRDLKKLTGLP